MTKIATQTFGLGKELTADLTGTIRALHGAGFQGIEPFLLFNEKQGKSPKNLWAFDTLKIAFDAMTALDMTIPSAHIGVGYGWFSMPMGAITKNILMLHETYGIRDFVISGPFGSLALAKHWAKLARKISDSVHPYGCRILYHNHDDEFKTVRYGGKTATAMDAFLDQTGSQMHLQVDIGWAGLGGDEQEIVSRYRDRIASLHLKDFYSAYRTGAYTRKNMPAEAFAPIGEGAVHTREILSVIGGLPNFGGTVIIDQDKYSGDMLQSLTTGCRNIRTMLEA